MGERTSGARLRHPLYLNVAMLIDFLAAIDGDAGGNAGLARRVPDSTRAQGPSSAGLENGRPDAGEGGRPTRRQQDAAGFHRLMALLEASGAVTTLAPEDAGWASLAVGDLVQVSGEIVPNPIATVTELFARAGPPAEEPVAIRGADTRKPKAGQSRRGAYEPENDAMQMLRWIREDLEAARVQDVLLEVGRPAARTCVLTLPHPLDGDRDLDDLVGAEITVIGKVTRALGEHDSLNLLRRSILGFASSEAFRQDWHTMVGSPDVDLKLADIEVRGPSAQILPLAIFV